MWIERLQQIQFFNRLALHGQVEKEKKKTTVKFLCAENVAKNIIINLLFFFYSAPSFMRPSTFNFFTRTNSNKLFKFMCFVWQFVWNRDDQRLNTNQRKMKNNEKSKCERKSDGNNKKTQNHYRRYFHVAITLHHQRATSDP